MLQTLIHERIFTQNTNPIEQIIMLSWEDKDTLMIPAYVTDSDSRTNFYSKHKSNRTDYYALVGR